MLFFLFRENTLVIINPGLGDKLLYKNIDNVFANTENTKQGRYMFPSFNILHNVLTTNVEYTFVHFLITNIRNISWSNIVID